ncbi:MAG: hypothetical protein AAFR21_09240 [Pseudomonadota bacterium]
MKSSHISPEAVCLAAAILIGCIAIGMRLMAPAVGAGYVSNGFMLPASRYSLILPLIACGFVFSGDRPVALGASLTAFVSTLWLALCYTETLFISLDGLIAYTLGSPFVTTSMALAAGSALLLPPAARQWLAPLVGAICGSGLGLSIGPESPGDDYSGWFLAAGGLGGMGIVIASIAMARTIRQIGNDPLLTIIGRILGSWLIAASLMLAALALVPKRPINLSPLPAAFPDSINVPR